MLKKQFLGVALEQIVAEVLVFDPGQTTFKGFLKDPPSVGFLGICTLSTKLVWDSIFSSSLMK